MTKLQTALLAFTIAFFGSCDLVPTAALAFGHKAPEVSLPDLGLDPDPAPAPSPSPVLSVAPVPALGTAPKISIAQVSGETDAELAMIDAGLELVNQEMSEPCFKQWILAATYTENNGLTQEQIWDQIQTEPVTVDVEMYSGSWKENHIYKTVGYENQPYDGVVHMNRYFVNTPFMVADNLVHEAEGHSQGFHHYGIKATSQPYGMNYALEGCSQAQQMQARGGKGYRPPGIRIGTRARAPHRRVIPRSHRHLSAGRCIDHGKWILGCR